MPFHSSQMSSLGVPGPVGGAGAKPNAGRSELARQKVQLKPGKGLRDWIRLSNAGRMSQHALRASVDHVELQRHCTQADCWILLFDTVFDVTSYLDFHPGGVPELMRAAGTDATDLFSEEHRWVNYKSMLKSCVIGPFFGQRDCLPRPKDKPQSPPTDGIAAQSTPQNEDTIARIETIALTSE